MGLVYLNTGPFYTLGSDNFEQKRTLDDGVYITRFNPAKEEIFLERLYDKFEFGFKLYNIDETLIKHILDQYNNQSMKKNIGILLNGYKGGGKTVMGKVIANRLGLPVIICDSYYPGIETFITRIQHDCVFFFDEFEKMFSSKSSSEERGKGLLAVMDGVLNNNCCHIFIMTTNTLTINENFINRPSRVRYVKSYSPNLDPKVINEIVDDYLKYPEYKESIMRYAANLESTSIDIVKTIIEEVNIHKCDVKDFKNFFNAKTAMYYYRYAYYRTRRGENYITNENEFIAWVNRYRFGQETEEDRTNTRYCTTNFACGFKFTDMRVGMKFYNEEVITKIDYDRSLIVTKPRDNSFPNYYYLLNPDYEPDRGVSVQERNLGYDCYNSPFGDDLVFEDGNCNSCG